MKTKKFGRTLLTIAALLGIGLIFIGVRFLIAPEAGEHGFGLNFAENGDYSFHRIKGVRDLFSGLLMLVFALLGRRAELAITLGLGSIIPFADFLVLLNAPNSNLANLWIHAAAMILGLILAGFLIGSVEETDGGV